MGYHSDVRVMTNLEGFEEMREIAWKLAKEKNIDKTHVLLPEFGQDQDEFFDYYDVQEDYLCFGFDWVKWYDDYNNVSLFMEVLKVVNESGIDWQFMRIGEDDGDIESISSDGFYDSAIPVMRARVEIEY